MGVGVQVGSIVDSVGTPAFLNAFFSTIVGVLEDGRRGSRFPVLTVKLYAGRLTGSEVEVAGDELRAVQRELAGHPPDAVVWDVDDPAARPPWGHEISDEIESLADYFVSDTGRDLFALLTEAFEDAVESGRSVAIVAF